MKEKKSQKSNRKYKLKKVEILELKSTISKI